MEENKSSFIYKLQKNPFLVVLLIVVIGIAVFGISTLSTAIKQKVEASSTTVAPQVSTTTNAVNTVEKEDNKIEVKGMKQYSETIKKVEAFLEPNQVVFHVEFADKESLLEAHYASNSYSFNVVPMLCFYIDGGLQVKCPGELRLLSDGVTAVYSFSEIKNYVNAVFLTDGIVTDLSTLLDNPFNLYVEHLDNDGVGKTIAGTYAQTVEQFNLSYSREPADIVSQAEGIKKIETTVCDDFIWIDIYYTDEQAYNADNADLEKNFVVFGFEKGGNKYKRDFIVTEYENLYMNRCVFDAYAVKELADDMNREGITVKELFDEYAISVWATDYTTDKILFGINGETNVHDEIEEDNFAEFEDVEIME